MNNNSPISTREIIDQMGGIDAFMRDLDKRNERIASAKPHATVEEIYAIEPRLVALYTAIPKIVSHGVWDIQWSCVKRAFTRMVGWEAEKAELSSSQDYDLIYRHFLAEAEKFDAA